MMKKHLEQGLCLVAAIVSGVAPLLPDSIATGLVIAALNVTMALYVQRR